MTLVRLVCLTLALGAAACATGRIHEPSSPTPGRTYDLCSDPQFDCMPASAEQPARPIQVDTNLTARRSASALG